MLRSVLNIKNFRNLPKNKSITKEILAGENTIKAIILDGSGTIVDPGVLAPTVAFMKVFEKMKVPISEKEAREPMGNHKKTHIRLITQNINVSERWCKIYNRFPNENDVEHMFELFKPTQLEVLDTYGKEIPGVYEVCKNLHKNNYKLGFTTGFTREMVTKIFKVNPHFEPLFTTTVAADEVTVARPAPYMIYKNLEKMGIFDSRRVIKIDDTEMGMMEGRYAGCWCVGLSKYSNLMGMTHEDVTEFKKNHNSEYLKKKRLIEKKLFDAGAHYVIDDLMSFPEILQNIEKECEPTYQ